MNNKSSPKTETISPIRPLYLGLSFLIVLMVGISIQLPHLHDEIWQDEAYMLINYASNGPLYPFTHYRLPNNHPLISSLLSLFWEPLDSTPTIRTLPLFVYALSLFLISFLVARFLDWRIGLLTLILFVSSSVVENFALQLRGYGFSWPLMITLAVLTPLYAKTGLLKWAFWYGLLQALLIGIVPSNAVMSGILIIWGYYLAGSVKAPFSKKLIRIFLLSLLPLLGLLFYTFIWQDLLAHSRRPFSEWQSSELFLHLSNTLLMETWIVLVALIIFSILGYQTRLKLTPTLPKDLDAGSLKKVAGLSDLLTPRDILTLLIIILLVALGWIFGASNPPFPRNFIPLLPILFLIPSYFLVWLWDSSVKHWFSHYLFIFLSASILILFSFTPSCDSLSLSAQPKQNLCYLPYRVDFHPTQALLRMYTKSEGKNVMIVTGYDGFYALKIVIDRLPFKNLLLVHYSQWQTKKDKFKISMPSFIVARSTSSMQNMLQAMEISHPYRMWNDSGYFKIYMP